MILNSPAPGPTRPRTVAEGKACYSCQPRRGLLLHYRTPQSWGEAAEERGLPRLDATSTARPYSGSQALQRPTCEGTGRRKSRTALGNPALPPPISPVKVSEEAARETAALGPRSAVAAHNTALFPPSRRPAARRPPDAKSNIPHRRSGNPRLCGGRQKPLRAAGLNRARPAP